MALIITLPLSVSNAFLVKGEKGYVLFDSGVKKDEQRLLKLLQQHNVSPKDISLIFHTHGHPDHVGSTLFLRASGAGPSSIYKPDQEMMETGSPDLLLKGTTIAGMLLRPMIIKPFPPVKSEIVFEREQSLHAFGLDAAFVCTPGHTDGSLSVIFKNGDVIAGDLLSGSMLRKQTAMVPMFNRDGKQTRDSVKAIVDRCTGNWYVGHGGPLTQAAVKRWLEKVLR